MMESFISQPHPITDNSKMDSTKPRRKKKSVLNAYDNLKPAEVIARLELVPNDRGQRAFLAALWLFGNRVSELLGIPPRIQVGEYKATRKKAKGGVYEFVVKKYRYLNEGEWVSPPVVRVKIQDDPLTNSVLLETHTLKIEGRPVHDYRAILDLPEDRRAWEILSEYLAKKPGLEPVWGFRRTTGWYYCDKYLGVPPHKLRSLRASRDAEVYGLDAIDLKNKFNWKDPGMPFHYAAKNPRGIINKMRQTLEQNKKQTKEHNL